MRIRPILALCIVVGIVTPPAGAHAFEGRDTETVLLQGSQIPAFAGRPIALLRLYAQKDGRLEPIPYQIDERNEDDDYVLTAGPERSKDEDKGRLDANDELVFVATDTGPKVSDASALPGEAMRKELRLRDPLDGKEGFAYLLAFEKEAPPPSPADYVTYDPKTDISYTRAYTMGFDPEYRFAINLLGNPPPQFDPARNPVDILKIRMDATVLGFHLTRTQEDFNTKLGGWIDGPVRIIKWTGLNMRVVAFIRSPRIWNYTFFYPNSFSYDMGIKTPVAIPKVCSKFSLYSGMDFRDLHGGELYGKGFTKPYVVTGVPGSNEIQSINANADRNDFFAAKWEGKWWLVRILLPPNVPLEPDLYLIDDASKIDPPENHPGAVPGVYFNIKNWLNVYEKNFTIRSFVIVTDAFSPGQEDAFFRRQDNPIFLVNPDTL